MVPGAAVPHLRRVACRRQDNMELVRGVRAHLDLRCHPAVVHPVPDRAAPQGRPCPQQHSHPSEAGVPLSLGAQSLVPGAAVHSAGHAGARAAHAALLRADAAGGPARHRQCRRHVRAGPGQDPAVRRL